MPANVSAQTDSPALNEYVHKAMETCGNIATKAKDIKVLDYCIAEVMRPLIRGKSCIAFVATNRDPGYHCEKGLLYYDPPQVASTKPMTKEELTKAFCGVVSKYTRKGIAACLLNSDDNDQVVTCLESGKKRLKEVIDKCSNIEFEVNAGAPLIKAVDHCIEYGLKLGEK
jgi:hypothetical protein